MPTYYDFEVHLADCEPRMWRRFLLHLDATFEDLHNAIQDACGWTHSHLFEFRDAGGRNSIAVSEHVEEAEVPPADEVPLSSYFKSKRKCQYQYDFGDCWNHIVELKGKVELPEKFRRRLLDGLRSFPPEDCGGTWGYEECCYAATVSEAELKKMDALGREEVGERREWLGDWHPEAFDLQAAKEEFDK